MWWQHYILSDYRLPIFTKTRLAKVKPFAMEEPRLWQDVDRHRLNYGTPKHLKESFFHHYEHCMSNMGAIIREIMTKYKIIK